MCSRPSTVLGLSPTSTMLKPSWTYRGLPATEVVTSRLVKQRGENSPGGSHQQGGGCFSSGERGPCAARTVEGWLCWCWSGRMSGLAVLEDGCSQSSNGRIEGVLPVLGHEALGGAVWASGATDWFA